MKTPSINSIEQYEDQIYDFYGRLEGFAIRVLGYESFYTTKLVFEDHLDFLNEQIRDAIIQNMSN